MDIIARVAIGARTSRRRFILKSYIKPFMVKLGTLALIKSNATGPSSDGKKYAGFFK